MSKFRIFVADDHESVREGLKSLINAQPDMEVIGEAENGRDAAERAAKLLPDVLVMDVSMPEMNGRLATAKLKESCPQINILTLTRHADDGYVQELLRAGASGYVLKQSPLTELISAIRAVAGGNKYLDPAVTDKVIGNFARKRRVVGEPDEGVTARESEVLRHISLGYSNKEIANTLNISVKTVEAHKANAMRKLDMSSRSDIVRHAILQGWLQES